MAVIAINGCKRSASEPVALAPVVYTSVDEEFARMVLAQFEQQTGIQCQVLTDSEAGKTTGLVNRIIEEDSTGRRRADVFWSSELYNTVLLARRGLLEPYDSPAARDIPERFRDPDRRWTATAVRARVLALDPVRFSNDALPQRWDELASPQFPGKLAFANPLFGTTRGHVAAMFALWGPDRARRFLMDLRDRGAYIADGNSAAVRAVLDGRADMAATDSDDVWVAQRGGGKLDLRYLDMGDGGTLLIPCSVALIAGSTSKEARKLIDFLVSVEVERLLATSASKNIPVRPALREQLGMNWPPESKVTCDAIADAMDEAVAAVREILLH